MTREGPSCEPLLAQLILCCALAVRRMRNRERPKERAAGPGHVTAFYIGHILSDYVWYVAVGIAVVLGRNLLKGRAYRWMMAGLGIALGGFGLLFLVEGITRAP